MLEHLNLNQVGPAPKITMDLTPRMNFLTGDNGLGKTFLLDIAWWALTRTWVRSQAQPHRGIGVKPSIAYKYAAKTKKPSHKHTSSYDYENQTWPRERGRPPIPGMVIYAQVDGGFSVWDPARNYWNKSKQKGPERPKAFLFKPNEVWDGLEGEEGKMLCNGLISDWAMWQSKNGEAFEQLKRVLNRLSPSPEEPLSPGDLARVSVDDSRDHPTLKMPYDQEVALVHSSAGLRRIVTLAYLLVWTWQEHMIASQFLNQDPTREIIFLIDEIEAHLHPKWQRRIVPSLLEVMQALTGEHDVPVQLFATTHSPLVLASLEPLFSNEDAVWELELNERAVELQRFQWRRHGDVNAWLASEIFELDAPTSVEAEFAMKEARELLRQNSKPSQERLNEIDEKLRRALSDMDPFWVRWGAFIEKHQETS